MTNPVLVEVTRGQLVESRHRGAVAIFDADGARLFAAGDIEAPVFPRSAVKALQALPLVETGAADAFGFGIRELALAQASHSGEPRHVECASAMLAAIGLDEAALECGAHSAEDLIRRGRNPNQLHNNCSGKHASFLAVCRHLGIDHRGYVAARHKLQEIVREAMEGVTGAAHAVDVCGTDGCSIPTYAVPLGALAQGFARLGTGAGLSPERAEAAKRVYAAAVAEPYYVAGSGRFCTEAMQLLKGAALLKTGAEGVFCGAIPGRGLGVALKCDDGAGRASEAMMAAVLARLFPEQQAALEKWTLASVPTRRGVRTGEVRAVSEAFRSVNHKRASVK